MTLAIFVWWSLVSGMCPFSVPALSFQAKKLDLLFSSSLPMDDFRKPVPVPISNPDKAVLLIQMQLCELTLRAWIDDRNEKVRQNLASGYSQLNLLIALKSLGCGQVVSAGVWWTRDPGFESCHVLKNVRYQLLSRRMKWRNKDTRCAGCHVKLFAGIRTLRLMDNLNEVHLLKCSQYLFNKWEEPSD